MTQSKFEENIAKTEAVMHECKEQFSKIGLYPSFHDLATAVVEAKMNYLANLKAESKKKAFTQKRNKLSVRKKKK